MDRVESWGSVVWACVVSSDRPRSQRLDDEMQYSTSHSEKEDL